MTAEIAIMNKIGVALAADSAVTISSNKGLKIYNANKLFMLSRHQPVGIMLFSDAEMMRIPWETIIKSYRRRLADTHFDSLEEYGHDFIAHLDKNTFLFPEVEQVGWLYHRMREFLLRVRKEIDDEVKSLTQKKGSVTADQIKRIVAKVIREHHQRLAAIQPLPTLPPKFDQEVWKKHGAIIEQAIKSVFGTLPLSPLSDKRLRRFCGNVLVKDRRMQTYSGIVIAGFGEKDLFPSLYAYQLEGLINDTLRWSSSAERKINRDNNAGVFPFAQSEMVSTFMEGIDPLYLNFLRQYMTALFNKYPEDIVKDLPKLTANEKKAVVQKVRNQSQTLIDDLFKATSEYGLTQITFPIIDTVAFLPLQELALMAETLVSLTSFKRRVTMVPETVSGPIDVAVISKGDGFIWINRKQYFESEPNRQFYANYFG